MKKLLEIFFFMVFSVSGLSGMFSSEDGGLVPDIGFRFKDRTVRYNKDLRLVIPKACRDQKLYDWVCTDKKDENGESIWERKEVIKKEIDPSLLDDEGNLIIAKWFESKKCPFKEPKFEVETTHTVEDVFYDMKIKNTTTTKHAYDDEYGYKLDETTRAQNKDKIHSYINNIQSQQGIWTCLRNMRIVEWLYGESQQKEEHSDRFDDYYERSLKAQQYTQYDLLKGLLADIDLALNNSISGLKPQEQKILQKQRMRFANEIESLNKKENYPSFVRSSMKKSEFDKYQQFRKAIDRE